MELRCPDCCSPEVLPDPRKSPGARRCGNCNASFHRDSALVTVADAESGLPEEGPPPHPLFGLDWSAAAKALSDPEGVIKPITPFSEADELHGLFESALGVEIIICEFESAYISVYPMSIANPQPLPAVEIGGGVVLVGSAMNLEQDRGEDPIAYTLRIMAETLSRANELSASFGQAERRLDRIAEERNRGGRWDSVEFIEFVGKGAAPEWPPSPRRRIDAAPPGRVAGASTPPMIARSACGSGAPAPATGGGEGQRSAQDERPKDTLRRDLQDRRRGGLQRPHPHGRQRA